MTVCYVVCAAVTDDMTRLVFIITTCNNRWLNGCVHQIETLPLVQDVQQIDQGYGHVLDHKLATELSSKLQNL